MLRYKTETRPGLVALYDIRPGNGAGQFLQLRSPHGVQYSTVISIKQLMQWTKLQVNNYSGMKNWSNYLQWLPKVIKGRSREYSRCER